MVARVRGKQKNMNKRILISLSVIAAVAAIVIGGTVAYFSDTETSTGNVFAAGSIDLKIDNECYFSGGECPWSPHSWALTDLEDGVHKFFNFGDIKPGHWGRDKISLHVYDNPAWVWMKIDNLKDYDNGCNDPECKAKGGAWDSSAQECDIVDSCDDPGLGQGELSQNMSFLIWIDTNENGVFDAGEEKLYEGNLSACQYWLIDGVPPCSGPSGGPMQPCNDYYVGVQWCFGEFDSSYNCSGISVGNEVQTDSLEMDISFIAIQSQNNPSADGGPSCPI